MQIDHFNMAPITIGEHREAIRAPQLLLKQVIRQKIDIFKQAADRQLQMRCPMYFQPATNPCDETSTSFFTHEERFHTSYTKMDMSTASTSACAIDLPLAELQRLGFSTELTRTAR